ncbi:hypothetical protein [Methylobacterium sp.]|uniref:hypothetical protein n=1 Tax=Methylobacterium sp. TaxID=409 RepID=UPI003B024D5C
MGTVIGDHEQSRRGQIQGQEMRGNANVINCDGAAGQHVRLRQQLRSFSQGRAILHDAV